MSLRREVEFVGGPLDGAVRQLPTPLPPTYECPVGAKPPTFGELPGDPSREARITVHRYWRIGTVTGRGHVAYVHEQPV